MQENTDILGNKWVLATGGFKELQQCQRRLWLIEVELHSIAALLQNIGPEAALGGNELYGTGHTLQRISKQIGQTKEKMNQVIKVR